MGNLHFEDELKWRDYRPFRRGKSIIQRKVQVELNFPLEAVFVHALENDFL